FPFPVEKALPRVNVDGVTLVGSAIDASFRGQAFRRSWSVLAMMPAATVSKPSAGRPRAAWSASAFCREVTKALPRARKLRGRWWSVRPVRPAANIKPTAGRPRAAWSASAFCREVTKALPLDVNADGKVVVGQANDASDQPQAFRWTRATRMQSVLTLLQAAKVVFMA